MDSSTSNKSSFQDASNRLSALIKKIAYADRMDNATAETYAEKLNDYYNAGHYNLYSSTYQWMRSDAADDSDLDYLEYNFNQIIAAYQRKYPKDEEGQKRVTKLADYILLEQARKGVQSSLELDVKSNLTDAKIVLQDLKKLKGEIEDSRKESSAQTITVLSIFTGIAMAFFGGFSLLGSAFGSLQYGAPAVAIVSLIVGLILFNTIFVFLYVASKISGNPISGCGNRECISCQDDCEGKESWRKRISKRYQFIYVINKVLLFVLAVSVVIYLATGGIKTTADVSSSTATTQSASSELDDASSSVAASMAETVPQSQSRESAGSSRTQSQSMVS